MGKAAGQSPDRSLELWQQRTSRELTQEDGRELARNLCGFFILLGEWKRRAGPTDESASKVCDGGGFRHQVWLTTI